MKENTLHSQALLLEYFTVAYNVAEAVISILFGMAASSIALIGFGLDSIVESLSGLVLIWRLRMHGRVSEEEEDRIEKQATRFVGLTFLLLAGYICFESIKKLVLHEVAEPSFPGIIIAAVSLIVMPFLGFLKLRTGQKLGLSSLIADSKETFVCATLSAALLVGLVLRYSLNIWIADPIAGLIIAVYLIKEGIELAKGECDECD